MRKKQTANKKTGSCNNDLQLIKKVTIEMFDINMWKIEEELKIFNSRVFELEEQLTLLEDKKQKFIKKYDIKDVFNIRRNGNLAKVMKDTKDKKNRVDVLENALYETKTRLNFLTIMTYEAFAAKKRASELAAEQSRQMALVHVGSPTHPPSRRRIPFEDVQM